MDAVIRLQVTPASARSSKSPSRSSPSQDPPDVPKGNIKVVCRFRPLNERERSMNISLCANFDSDGKTVSIVSSSEQTSTPPKFTFDSVFPPDSQQAAVYDVSARPIVESVLEGFNGTVFAYGQTGSGKTFTMTGPNVDDEDLKGVIPRMVNTVFEKIRNASDHLEFSVKVGYAEIYMEKVKDLLDPAKSNLKVHEDKARGVYIADLTEEYVSGETEVYDLMKLGADNREVGATLMNQQSSRSHSLFILTVTQNNTRDFAAKTGKLYLVDLAGSEKVGKTGAEGKRLDEAKTINKSLSTLGKVINALTDGKSTHVPYRDSKLTRVLQDSLGGNAKTALIITCSPSGFNEAETLGTLRFGIRAKAIKNKPKVNREYTVAELKLLLSKAEAELTRRAAAIELLTGKLQAVGGGALTEEDLAVLRESYASEREENLQQGPELEELGAEMDSLRERLEEERRTNADLAKEVTALSDTSARLLAEKEHTRLELEAVELRLGSIDGELKDKAAESLRLRQSNSDLSTQLSTSQQLNSQLQSTLSQLRSEQAAVEAEVRSMASRTSSAKLLDDLEQKDAAVRELRGRVELQESVLHQIGSCTGDTRILQILQKYRSSDADQIVAAQELLQHERERNQRLLEQVTDLNSQVMMLVSSKVPEYQEIRRKIEAQVTARELERWETERKMLMKDLQNRVDKVVRLEIELDELNESYSILLSSRTQGDPRLLSALNCLQQENDELTKRHQAVLREKGEMAGEVSDLQAKCRRMEGRTKELEGRLETALGELKGKAGRIEEMERHLEDISRTSVRSLSIAQHIRKRIKGGTKDSVDFSKQPFEIQEEEESKG